MFTFQLVEACHQYNKHKTEIIKICNALLFNTLTDQTTNSIFDSFRTDIDDRQAFLDEAARYSFLDSDVKKRLKNKLCFILCQDKAFEDKMNC
jgi:hypothetical protein